MRATYEWDVEIVQAVESAEREAGEILQHIEVEDYASAVGLCHAWSHNEPSGTRIALVRQHENEVNFKAWAYVVGGKLPTHFEDASGCPVASVPKRFHTEVAANGGAS